MMLTPGGLPTHLFRVLFFCLLAAAAGADTDIDDSRLLKAAEEEHNWLAHGRTWQEQRYSTLADINRNNVRELGLAWYRNMNTTRGLEATPIVVDGVMYLSSTWSRVHAIDAASGDELWSFDPKVERAWGRRACCDVVNRGVAVYRGRVYVGTLDGRLIALDAQTGAKQWEVNTIDRERDYTITGAPRVARGKVFIGNGGAELGVRGYVSAYDADTGELAWRFYTVPGDPAKPFEHPELAMAVKTWSGDRWWRYGGGGTVWNSMVYDAQFNHLYIGVGNGSPWPRDIRSPGGGDNLFLSSIVALDADSGEMQWYYQTTPGDNWDYTAVQDIMLAEMMLDGKAHKVLMQAPKNGFFYVLDREDGSLLRAHNYVPVTWASHVDLDSGRPVENPGARYGKDAVWLLPGSPGGHGWQAMAYNPTNGLVYLPTHQLPGIFALEEGFIETGEFVRLDAHINLGIEFARINDLAAATPGAPPIEARLKAFDPLTGKERWSVANDYHWNGGVLATAGGLVFQGDGSGHVTAYDADTGTRLWRSNVYTSIMAPPVTYKVKGEQYVALLAGTGGGDIPNGYISDSASLIYGNAGKLLAFKLKGKAVLPVPEPLDKQIPVMNVPELSDEQLARGDYLYHDNCAACHGGRVRSSGVIPDLRYSSKATHAIFKNIVLDGVYEMKGMASFADLLSPEDAELVHAYIIGRAQEDRKAPGGREKQ